MSETPVATRKCPYCSEMNPADSVVCAHCGRDLARQPGSALPAILIAGFIGLIIIGCVVAIMGYGWFMMLASSSMLFTFIGIPGALISIIGVLLALGGLAGILGLATFMKSAADSTLRSHWALAWITIGMVLATSGLDLIYFANNIYKPEPYGDYTEVHIGAASLLFLMPFGMVFLLGGLVALLLSSGMSTADMPALRPWRIISIVAPVLVLLVGCSLLSGIQQEFVLRILFLIGAIGLVATLGAQLRLFARDIAARRAQLHPTKYQPNVWTLISIGGAGIAAIFAIVLTIYGLVDTVQAAVKGLL